MPSRGLGLVLADDAEGLAAAVVALDRDGRAELHLSVLLRRGHQLRGGAARGPVAQVAPDARERRAVAGGLRRARAPRAGAPASSSICARPCGVTRLGCSEIGRSGRSSKASPPSGSLTNARLMNEKVVARGMVPQVRCGLIPGRPQGRGREAMATNTGCGPLSSRGSPALRRAPPRQRGEVRTRD